MKMNSQLCIRFAPHLVSMAPLELMAYQYSMYVIERATLFRTRSIINIKVYHIIFPRTPSSL